MQILIVEDERWTRQELVNIVSLLLPSSKIDAVSSGREALDCLNEKAYNLCFFDIQLQDIIGVTLAKMAIKLYPTVAIIFVTAYADYAVKAFELEAKDYILKPFDEKRVQVAIDRVLSAVKNEFVQTKLAIEVEKKYIILDIRDIVYIESHLKKCSVHTSINKYETSGSLTYYEEKLNKDFIRCHKSYLVNINHITQIEPWFNQQYCIKLKGVMDSIPVSRKQYKLIKEVLHL